MSEKEKKDTQVKANDEHIILKSAFNVSKHLFLLLYHLLLWIFNLIKSFFSQKPTKSQEQEEESTIDSQIVNTQFDITSKIFITQQLVVTEEQPAPEVQNSKKEEIKNLYNSYVKKEKAERKFDQKQFTDRTNAINELITTEVKYKSFLETLLTLYRSNLSKVIPPDTDKLFFGNIEPLIQLSKSYSDSFAKEYKRGIDKCVISNCFKTNESLRIFAPYISSYNEILSEYSKLIATNKKAKKLIQTIETTNPTTLFMSLMIMPIQRLTRYVLLLKTIDKATPDWHEDHKKLGGVIERIQQLAEEADRKCTENDNKRALVELALTIPKSSRIIKPSRTLICAYQLSNGLELNLLNDVILLTKFDSKEKEKKHQRTLKAALYLKDIMDIKIGDEMIVINTRKSILKMKANKENIDFITKVQKLMKKD
ncbi:RhoGEF domain containing protein [Histomonas meleagridis]|uniref:RhoGEF domain containing protein n=1 Tax=Histomonas meleagridis TaxID=135588 RepID=UPI003559A681|nr:RhoGEF domain containing protein [Histomonas meleagridis]KAH0799319.1 RhoGEF domain containing protein [Histomonas meleagridis]